MATTNITSLEEACQELQKVSYTRPAETLPEIFGIANKEVYITQWLARILDPKNGFGYEPLHCLLHCAEGYENVELEEDDDLKIYTEYVFPDARRIDILIESDKYIIGIENKIDSDEQKDQTKDYYKSITDMCEHKSCYCIYLKPEYNQSKPSSKEKFKEVTYTDFKMALKADVIEAIDRGENDRNIWLMKEFIKYIDEVLTMANKTFSENVQLYAKYYAEINKAREEYEDLLESIEIILKNKIDENNNAKSEELTWKKVDSTVFQINNIDCKNHFHFHYEVIIAPELLASGKILFLIHLEQSNQKNYANVLKAFNDKATSIGILHTTLIGDKGTCTIYSEELDIIENKKVSEELLSVVIEKVHDNYKWHEIAEKVKGEIEKRKNNIDEE